MKNTMSNRTAAEIEMITKVDFELLVEEAIYLNKIWDDQHRKKKQIKECLNSIINRASRSKNAICNRNVKLK